MEPRSKFVCFQIMLQLVMWGVVIKDDASFLLLHG
jgi:hypothetical protein